MTGIHRTGRAAVGLLCAVCVFSGCGAAKAPDTIENTSLIIDKEGTVTSHIVGTFDKEYYDLQGLRAMAQEEAAAYNTAHQSGAETPVQVEQVAALEGAEGRVRVTYRFDSADTYRKYNGGDFFYGTVGQAGGKFRDPAFRNQTLYDAKGSRSMAVSELSGKDMAGRHLVIAEEPAYIYCPYKVAYVSEGAAVRGDGSVDATEMEAEDFPVIILMKK